VAKPFAEKFYKSKAWQRCRASYIASVFGICERCGGPGLIVHHKIMLTPENINNPDVTLNWEHLELLCLDCHNREHGNPEDVVRDGLKFDERGDLVGT
jgi:5-methylcytosine-specific restriction endonuclease McrA